MGRPKKFTTVASTAIEPALDGLVRELVEVTGASRSDVLRAMLHAGARSPDRVRKLLEAEARPTKPSSSSRSSTGAKASVRGSAIAVDDAGGAGDGVVHSIWTDAGIEARVLEAVKGGAKVIPLLIAAVALGAAPVARAEGAPAEVVVLRGMTESEGVPRSRRLTLKAGTDRR